MAITFTSRPFASLLAKMGLRAAVSALALTASICMASAADKVTFLTSWFAQAEHGGFYQAKATGLYEKAGLDVTIKTGGPQVNALQLLLAGETDIMMGYDIQVLKALEQKIPITTIAASFQFDLQGMMTHEDVSGFDGMKGKTILIAASSRMTYWPWLKAKYGLSDDQLKPYTFNLQPFAADENTVQQGYVSSEPYAAAQMGLKQKFYLFSDQGYPPYGSTMVVTRAFIEKNPDVAARFVKASLEGWRDYLKNPAPANALIKADNPKMRDDQLDYAIETLKRIKAVDGGDAVTLGIGMMTEARWKQTYEFLVAGGLLKPDVDWKAGFTDRFVKDLKIAP
jgi:NitT/TauT family transport system substrate-binding protein